MIAKRPEPQPTLRQLYAPVPPAAPLEQPPAPEAVPEPEVVAEPAAEQGEPDVAAELEQEPAKKTKRKKPKNNSGSLRDPYPCEDGRITVKTSLNFTSEFAEDFAVFAAQYLRTSTKSAWAQRVLQREIERTRKRSPR